MTTWSVGAAEIAELLHNHNLDRVSGESADGQYLVDQARTRLKSAGAALPEDPVSAFILAYDSIRQATTALLTHQGLRPTSKGGHIAIVAAARAQFGQHFDFFNILRRTRNMLEYPRKQGDLTISHDEARDAISYAELTIERVDKLLPALSIWQE